ncbi:MULTISPECIES: LemA family protein [unclassified Mucilaginibacter]|uniref:LemA family protein n=1 Tax=unclassified Mucilaginibacter TaxID=2617802 RepID=UPI002AC8EC77|nr:MULTISPECIES: LemA family protein [unclassified Mucilaginibacter]MEB0249549.1 LemA family protein [Mucilaginibacter sp. 5B2]MEB0262141.1 LemA family protein [Mucilaginibacter sp. 10I4]MEB0279802.1 LemA family protein [Mucilaginibacter sp. 10B2]MEB0301246.1 LemA family protein [Mucilaginibacter sp. 5C4]WPX24226.1 LemA family protein [Mucilaginibacter sp. 5C4]
MKNLLIVIAVVVVLALMGGCSYNGMVKSDENVKGKWGEVQTQYQRRSDLIPNLVSTVKGEANFEKGTLTEVTNARARATSIQVDPTKLTPEAIQQYQQAQGQLSTALGRLLVASENYPTLRANDAFRGLQVQLEGTENRISVARRDFNESVQTYNSKVRTFPANITAKLFGFSEKGYFQSEAGSDKAPKVSF